MDEHDTLTKLLSEIARLQQAARLLEDVWSDVGPYGGIQAPISHRTMNGLRKYFKFDDGE